MVSETQDELQLLCAALAPAIGLPARGKGPVLDKRLARIGDRRHRIGPLLHYAAEMGTARPDAEAGEFLAQVARSNAAQQLRLAAARRQVETALSSARVPFLMFKGSALARELYGKAELRRMRDIDVLVEPEHLRMALAALENAGFELVRQDGSAAVIRGSWRQRGEARVFKDQVLREPTHGVHLELHRRLFKVGPKHLTKELMAEAAGARDASLTMDHYALYLILHGALDYWPRLKWLADLSLLARKLSADQRARVLALAERYDCREAVIASLLFCEAMLPGTLDGCHWGIVRGTAPGTARQKRLFERFGAALGGHAPHASHQPPPIPTGDNPARLVFGRAAPLAAVLAQRLLKSILLRV